MRRILPILLGCLLPFPCVTAEEGEVSAVKELEAKYNQALELAAEPLRDLSTRYVGELEKLKQKFQQAGNLDAALQVDGEIKNFGKEGDRDFNKLPGLLRLRKIYDDARPRLEKTVSAKQTEIHRQSMRKFGELSESLTKKGDLAAAVKSREIQEAIGKSLEAGAAPGITVQPGAAAIPPDAKRFRSSGYYLLSIQEGGLSYPEAVAIAAEKGGEVFTPKSRRDVEAMLEIVQRTRTWTGLKYDQGTKKLMPDGPPSEPLDPDDLGIEKIDFNPDNIGHDLYLGTNGAGGFKVARKEPVVKNAIVAVMIYFENSDR